MEIVYTANGVRSPERRVPPFGLSGAQAAQGLAR